MSDYEHGHVPAKDEARAANEFPALPPRLREALWMAGKRRPHQVRATPTDQLEAMVDIGEAGAKQIRALYPYEEKQTP